MPEEEDPPQPPPPDPPSASGWNVLSSDAASDEGSARSKPATSGARRDWEPPTVEEAAALFSGYKVLKLLGRGGMGAVYQARQLALGRIVAIKLLPLEISTDKGFADRFRREAHAMGKLNHPNIVAVYDFGATGAGHLYFIMEYVDGANLADVIREIELNAEQALSIVEQVCTALAYAHGKGIVHRDIKPANVMIDSESHVKVTDFGLARLMGNTTTDLGQTSTSLVMGTPDYMAPEQTHGMNVDHRADIFSVGVMLYEMLCRDVPKGSFDLPSQRTGCDARIDQIVIRAIQQAPERRYQSTVELKSDVVALRTAMGMPAPVPVVPAPKAAPTPSRKVPLLVGVGVVVIALVVGIVFWMKPKASPAPTSATEAAPVVPAHEDTSPTKVANLPKPAVAEQEASSPTATATKEHPFVNTLGMKFVPVPIIGGPTGGQRVLFNVWDTRVQDYRFFADETKRRWQKPNFEQEATHPAVNVTWDDAQAFCTWLTGRERAAGGLRINERYRLPTDHEWSCAAGIGEMEDPKRAPSEKSGKIKEVFSWGKEWPPPKGAGNFAGEEVAGTDAFSKAVIEGYNDGFVHTSPVGRFAVNPFGIFDMAGNVKQWCEDWYGSDQKQRVLRGSDYGSADRNGTLPLSIRGFSEPDRISGAYGFRCVLAADASLLTQAASTPSLPATPAASPKPAAASTVASPRPAASSPAPSTPAVAAPPPPLTEVEKWFAQVDAPQEEAFQKQVQKPFEAAVAGLRTRYLASVDGSLAKASAAGQLAEALVWRTERQAFEKGQNEAAVDAETPAVVKTLRAAYRQELARLEDDRQAKAKALLVSYDAILAKNQTLLTQRQRLDDALLLKNKRDQIALAWLGPAKATPAAATPEHPEPAKPVAATPKSPTPATSTPGSQTAALSTLTAAREHPFINSLHMKFVPVPITGGPTDSQRVLFSIWDTRVQDYEEFARQTRHDLQKVPFPQGPTHPVVLTGWDDAKAFCTWLTDRERKSGKIGANEQYRLPTDHEWSCAVGIGDREDPTAEPAMNQMKLAKVYPWGDDWPPPKGAGNFAGEELRPYLGRDDITFKYIKSVIEGYHDGFMFTSPVGSFPANQFGLFDMAGNVEQWCEDWYDQNKKERVVRGGSFGAGAELTLLSAHRGNRPPDHRYGSIGFRCVIAPATPTPTAP